MAKSGKIRVHIADVDHLIDKTVHLSTGEQLAADVMVCAGLRYRLAQGIEHCIRNEGQYWMRSSR